MAEYIDITIVEAMDEPTDVYVYDDKGENVRHTFLELKNDDGYDVVTTTIRIQHNDIERL